MAKRVVITGAAGFIGSHLAEALVERGCVVVGIDNFVTGCPANVEPLLGRQFDLLDHDVTHPIQVTGPVSAVLHWASPASPVDYLRLPVETLTTGSVGTHNALDLARSKDATFVLASTSEVYGDPLVHPQPEDYWGNVNPVGPRSVYDEAKRFAEALTMAYRRHRGVDAKIVRIFNTYGPRMRANDGRAVPNFIAQALAGDALTLYGDGRQTRSFCYVSDLVDGVCRMMTSDVAGPVNLGNPHELTIREIAETILHLTDSDSELVYRPLPADDPQVRQPDIRQASRLLGWTPRVGLQDGLRSTIRYFESRLEVDEARSTSALLAP